MFCPDCGTILDDVPVADTCPGCGRRDATAQPDPVALKMNVPSPTAVGHSHPGADSESIQARSKGWAASGEAGSDRQTFEGTPPRGEEDVLEVCGPLREALRHHGEEWGPFQLNPGRADDVDAMSEDDAGNVLEVQVTEVERDVWEELGQHGEAQAQRNPDQLAAAILRAVEHKNRKYPHDRRTELVLALSARRSPGHVLRGVVNSFIETHAESAASFGFHAIWLVGPTADLTYKLC
jgi:hypothetical protein